MPADIYWIDIAAKGRLATMARPRAGEWLDGELASWKSLNLAAVVSLLEAAEVHELGLQREETLCQQADIEFISFPIPDRGVPDSRSLATRLAARIATRIAAGDAVAIHCRSGIGRSSLLAAAVLLHLGCDPQRSFDMIARVRGVPVPDTDAQRRWLFDLSTDLKLDLKSPP